MAKANEMMVTKGANNMNMIGKGSNHMIMQQWYDWMLTKWYDCDWKGQQLSDMIECQLMIW